ncbi:MAG: tetratricopeptide repeat protein [Chitinophagaceae bacterium]
MKKTEEEVVEAPETAPQAKKDKKDNTSYSEGLVWLAKTYTRTEQYSNAEFLLKNLEKTPGIKEAVLDEINPAMADLMIKQKEYETALDYLDKAIAGNGRKNDKARYAYIAGQIYRFMKNPAVASDYFLKAKNNAKDFKLKFMSELAYATTLASKSNGGPEATVRQLEKFLKEDKYREFRDQIYFSLGESVLPTDKAKAKEYFLESSKNNNNNVSLKTRDGLLPCYPPPGGKDLPEIKSLL